ncbi:MAG: RecQ family ATP-dependent DNA helicase [Polaribacter sp.]|jgi:ATP-dependent DNA helicase RecQ|nr:RecQ family ATP-dependent DNA helicase [Polaribacter sp.]MDA9969066.1 RecQ family ATP-dependent DNA helicase [Polaribacter sp.]MDG1222440.1 RecQ family ATP-dependent DNA helicase [Polaribacter sp.]
MISPREILKEYWGHSAFRPLQEEIIGAVLAQKNTVALLPTGGGKSICFQVPALLLKGVCIVISPLTALMEEQVTRLQEKGIKAMRIPAKSSQDEMIALFDNLKFGNFKFLYISPERLQSRFIQQKIKELTVSFVAIDEAHCISEWGHDFRSSYRKINILRELLPNVNFIALTATANQKVIEDIFSNLELADGVLFKQSFKREKLAYQIFTIEDKLNRLLQIFKKTKTPAIVYINSRKKVEEISNFLNANNLSSSFYHAGLSTEIKKSTFENWMTEKTPIIVATNAFGMGIDKANVGVVIHLNIPSSIENYVQEAGRAGRNGKKSFSVVLQNDTDIRLFKEQLERNLPTIKEIKEIYKKMFQHFQIGNGELLETPFEFNFLEFCEKYGFSSSKVTTCLKLLSNQGIVTVQTDFNKKSLVHFTTTSKKVINFTKNNDKLHQFISVVLRNYGGIFEQETKIDEYYLAKKAGITNQQVRKYLTKLEDAEVLIYKQAELSTEVLFLHPREDEKTINRNAKEIQQYLDQKRKKAADLIDFIKNNTLCRSKQILTYFDEKETKVCGICDVCLSNKKAPPSLRNNILELLSKTTAISSLEICHLIDTNEKHILIHLQTLLSEGKIALNHQNKFYLNNK